MREKLAIGIDFGTTNSIAAAWGEDVLKIQPQPEAFWDTSEGRKRPHASVVWYSPESNPIVGNTARAKMGALGGAMGHRFIRSIKRSLGDDRPHELLAANARPDLKLQRTSFSIFGSTRAAHSYSVDGTSLSAS